MASHEAKILIPWAVQNASSGDFLREDNGAIKLSNRFFNRDNSKAPEIQLKKVVAGDIIYISECVPDSVNKRIWITSAYIQKGNSGQLLNMEDISSPQPTPKASFDSTATTDIVTTQNETVKHNLEKTNHSFSPVGDTAERGDGMTVEQARQEGYPEIDGQQVVPNKTWVLAEDVMFDKSSNPVLDENGQPKRHHNYGVITGMTGNGRFLVSFRNKNETHHETGETIRVDEDTLPYNQMVIRNDGVEGNRFSFILTSS